MMSEHQVNLNEISGGRRQGRRAGRSAFTLIELLVVIALTLILVLLLFGPMIAGLKYTSQAQTLESAQDGQRLLMRQIMRDLASAAAIRDTQDKYLDVMVLKKASPTDSTGTQTLVHMYNAYTDVVPPLIKCQDTHSTSSGTCTETGEPVITDPTTGQNLVLTTQSGTSMPYGVSPGIVTPIAPGGSFTRYFVGLKYPFNFGYTGAASGSGSTAVAQPYSSIYDNQTEGHDDPYYSGEYTADQLNGNQNVIDNDLNNPYVIYVATVSPYLPGTTNVNTNLFQTDASGNNPVLDDPDFFRIVTVKDYLPFTDPAYVVGQAKTYSADQAQKHNQRVYNWYKAAHQIMGGRDYDVLSYARSGGNVMWDTVQASPQIGGTTYSVQDPLTGAAYSGYLGESSNAAGDASPNDFEYDTLHPILPGSQTGGATVAVKIRSLLSIVPAGYKGEAAKSTATDDASQGVEQTSNIDPGQQYIPTSYTLMRGQLKGSPNIIIDADANPPSSSGVPQQYVTGLATASDVGQSLSNGAGGGTVQNGDLMEYLGDGNGNPVGKAVYDVTQARAVSGQYNYVAFTYDPVSGRLNFATIAVPAVSSASNLAGNGDDNTITTGGNTTNYNVWWAAALSVPAQTTVQTDTYDPVTGDMVVRPADSNMFSPNPFYPNINGAATATAPQMNMVVNSERIKGPDRTQPPSNAASSPTSSPASNPINLALVPYTRVPFGSRIGPNQYSIEYRHAVPTGSGASQTTTYEPWIHLGPLTDWQAWLQQGGLTVGSLTGVYSAANTVLFSYSVQNNILTVNGLQTPATVTVSYASSSTMRVTLGLRVYDAFSGTASLVTSSNDVPVGNETR